MGLNPYVPTVNALLDRALGVLQVEGRLETTCYLFFGDGYAPLCIKQSEHYITYANAVISTVKPDAYLLIYTNCFRGLPGVSEESRWLTGTIVSIDSLGKTLGCRYYIRGGKVEVLDKKFEIMHGEFDSPDIFKNLYKRLPGNHVSHSNFRRLIDTVTAVIKVTKLPYIKSTNNLSS